MKTREWLVFAAFVAVVALLVLAFSQTKLVSISIDLPPAEPAKIEPAPPVFLLMKSDGGMTIDGAPTTPESLTKDLGARFRGLPKDQQRVMIRADEDVSYERFMPVLKQLQAHGWTKIGLVNEEIAPAKP